MKNHVKKFGSFINEELDDSVTRNPNRDKMVYLHPRSYLIEVELSPEYTGVENQAESEMKFTSKLTYWPSLKFDPSRGVNIYGNIASFNVESVFIEEDIRAMIKLVFKDAIAGEITIKETDRSRRMFESRSEDEEKTATIHLEFDWTWADQMSKSEAARALQDEFKRIGLPTGLKVSGKPTLSGWSGRSGAPKYHEPYEAEFEVTFTCAKSAVTKWANRLQLGDVSVDFD